MRHIRASTLPASVTIGVVAAGVTMSPRAASAVTTCTQSAVDAATQSPAPLATAVGGTQVGNSLPFTGASVLGLLILGLALVVVGLTVVRLAHGLRSLRIPGPRLARRRAAFALASAVVAFGIFGGSAVAYGAVRTHTEACTNSAPSTDPTPSAPAAVVPEASEPVFLPVSALALATAVVVRRRQRSAEVR